MDSPLAAAAVAADAAAVGSWLLALLLVVLADLSDQQQTIMCVMHMYMYRNACWCRGRVSSVSFFSLWPPFTPRSCPPTAATAGERFDAEGSSEQASRQGANPPLPLLVNTRSTRPGPALFSTYNSSPASSIFLYHRTYRSATCYYYVRTRTVRHLCLATFVRTPRSAHGTGAVRYGTARVESSPAQCRPGQHSIFHLSALTLFPMPFRDRQTFCLHQSLPPRVSSRTPAFAAGWLMSITSQNITVGQFARGPYYCLVPGPH